MRRDDHRLAGASASANDQPLDVRHVFRREFDAKIPARHHQRVGQRDDLVQMLDRRRFFDLGDDARPVADDRARFLNILGALHEGERDIVDADFQRVFNVGAVFFRQRGNRKLAARQIDALAA